MVLKGINRLMTSTMRSFGPRGLARKAKGGYVSNSHVYLAEAREVKSRPLSASRGPQNTLSNKANMSTTPSDEEILEALRALRADRPTLSAEKTRQNPCEEHG